MLLCRCNEEVLSNVSIRCDRQIQNEKKYFSKNRILGDSPDAQFMAIVSVLKMNPFVTLCMCCFFMYVRFHHFTAEAMSDWFRSLPYSCRNSL
jgi:hypothetical protein